MTEGTIRTAFAGQAEACRQLGSPFMAQLCGLFASRDWPNTPLTARIFDWPGDVGPRANSVPLRIAGALHALRLRGDAGLMAVYPPQDAGDDALWDAVTTAWQGDAAFIDTWIDSAPQTNEVRRAAVLIAVGHWLQARFALPLRLSELGASGGLNLMWDRFALQIGDDVFGADDPAFTLQPDWHGAMPPADPPQVVARGGVDLNPLDPNSPADATRLRAYLWADQPARLALTEAAISVAAAQVDRADGVDWISGRLTHVPGQCHLIYSTIAWQYFPAEARARGAALIAAAGAAATAEAPLAWFGMEADDQTPGAALTLRLWPGDITIPLGRADFHGRWVRWDAPEAAQ